MTRLELLKTARARIAEIVGSNKKIPSYDKVVVSRNGRDWLNPDTTDEDSHDSTQTATIAYGGTVRVHTEWKKDDTDTDKGSYVPTGNYTVSAFIEIRDCHRSVNLEFDASTDSKGGVDDKIEKIRRLRVAIDEVEKLLWVAKKLQSGGNNSH